MTTRSMKVRAALFAAVVLSIGLLVLNGCEKSEPVSPGTSSEATHDHDHGHDHEGHEHAAMEGQEHTAMEAKPAAQTASTVEQTTCPVMGGAINKDLFVEYKGKKVYFCCKGCEEQFLANPEQYVAKLPQFKQ